MSCAGVHIMTINLTLYSSCCLKLGPHQQTEILTIIEFYSYTERLTATGCHALRFSATGSTRKYTCCLITSLLRQQLCWFSFIKYYLWMKNINTVAMSRSASQECSHCTIHCNCDATRLNMFIPWTCSSQLLWVSDRRRQSQCVARVSHT